MHSRLLNVYHWWVRSVRRVTTSGEVIPEIDGLRFLAITGVFVHHVLRFITGSTRVPLAAPVEMDAVGRIADAGAYGVQLFFIISGFILGLPFAAHYLKGASRVPLGKYYLRRLTRLEPPYLAAMILCFALAVWVWNESAARLWPHLLASMVYVHNQIYGTHSLINPVAWSLEIEVEFYLAAPFLALIFAIKGRVRRRLVMLALIAALMRMQIALVPDGSRLYYSLAGFIHFFLAGFFLADVYVIDWRGAPQRSKGYDAAMLGCILAAGLLGGSRAIAAAQVSRYVTHWLALLVLFLPTVAAFRSYYFRRLMGNTLLASIGGMCYTIYLLHYEWMHLVARYTREWTVTRSLTVNLLFHTAVLGISCLLISTCFYLLIEKPCMRKDWPVRLYQFVLSWRLAPAPRACRVEEPIP